MIDSYEVKENAIKITANEKVFVYPKSKFKNIQELNREIEKKINQIEKRKNIKDKAFQGLIKQLEEAKIKCHTQK